jgi:hypothetical protein
MVCARSPERLSEWQIQYCTLLPHKTWCVKADPASAFSEDLILKSLVLIYPALLFLWTIMTYSSSTRFQFWTGTCCPSSDLVFLSRSYKANIVIDLQTCHEYLLSHSYWFIFIITLSLLFWRCRTSVAHAECWNNPATIAECHITSCHGLYIGNLNTFRYLILLKCWGKWRNEHEDCDVTQEKADKHSKAVCVDSEVRRIYL